MQSCSELGQRLVARWELVEKSQDEQQAKSNNSGRGRREGVCSLGGQQKVCWSGGKADQRNASASTEARAGTGEVAGRDDELGRTGTRRSPDSKNRAMTMMAMTIR